MKQETPYIGAHVSAAGGLYRAVEKALAIGANCAQIFGSSPRQWKTRFPTEAEARRYREAMRASKFGPTYLHAPYLVNLGSADSAIYENSVRSLADHLKIAVRIGAAGLIFHAGSWNGQENGAPRARVAEGVREALRSVPGEALLIIENSGSVKKIGGRFSEIGELMRAARSERVGVCIDTAHALEAGLIEAYTPSRIGRFLDEVEREVGLRSVRVIHANDSRTPFNSQHDVHENIGEGQIGTRGFRNLAAEKCLRDKAWIIETPGFDNLGPDKKNMDRLKACFGK